MKASIRQTILNDLAENEHTTVSKIAKKAGLSRAYIHRFFEELANEGKIVRIGRANRTLYVFAEPTTIKKFRAKITSFGKIFDNKNLKEDEVLNLIKAETGIFIDLEKNISHILDFALTEMINNAIEHSKSSTVEVRVERRNNLVQFEVVDRGVGIFENLIHKRRLGSVEEAIQDLLKGKQTTAPDEHSGEGIFFTRRAADIFIIKSSGKKLIFNNFLNDFTVTTIKPIFGTRVKFTVSESSDKQLRDIFAAYTSESFEFSKTEVVVKLYKPGGGFGTFVSRSQARRILAGLDKFKKIVLDFKGVSAIGQGFADEIFRIWPSKHKSVELDYVNANEDVEFMVKRSRGLLAAKT